MVFIVSCPTIPSSTPGCLVVGRHPAALFAGQRQGAGRKVFLASAVAPASTSAIESLLPRPQPVSMAEGGPAGDNNGGGGSGGSTNGSSMRRGRPLRRQQQQQSPSPETESAAGSKRRREEAPDEARAAVDGSPESEDTDSVAPPAAKQARGLYGRVSGLVGRAVNLLTPGRPRRTTPAASAAAAAAADMEDDGDIEAGRGASAAVGAAEGGRGQEPVASRPAAAAVSNVGEPDGPVVDPAVAAAASPHNGIVDDNGVGDAYPGVLFSPGVARRSEGPGRQARRARTGRGDGATPSSRRISGDGLGPASLRGSTAGDGAVEEFGLPPVPPFYPLGGGGGGRVSPPAGSVRGAGRGGERSATASRVKDGAGVRGGGPRPLLFGGGDGDGDGPAGPSPAASNRKKSKGKGRAGGVADAELQEEEEEEDDEDGSDEDRQVGGHAVYTATERRDLFRSRASHRGLSAWEMLYLLGHLRDPEATLVKERCVQIYNKRMADAESAAAIAAAADATAAAQDDSVTGTGGAQQQRRRRPDTAAPLFRPSPARKKFPPGADLVPSAPSSRSSPFLMAPPPPRAASGFPAAAVGGSQELFGGVSGRGGGGRGGGGGGQFGVRGGMPPPAGRGDNSGDLLTPAKRAQVEAERGDGRER